MHAYARMVELVMSIITNRALVDSFACVERGVGTWGRDVGWGCLMLLGMWNAGWGCTHANYSTKALLLIALVD